MNKIFVMIALAGLALAESCPDPQLQEDFQAAPYMGQWYEQMRTKAMPFQKYDCDTARYNLQADGSVAVLNSEFNPNTGGIEQARGTAWFKGPRGKVKFSWFMPGGDYRVVATDYTNYAVVYSCSNILFWKGEYAWILTREKNPREDLVFYAFQTLQKRVPTFKLDDFHRTIQGGSCRYLNDVSLPKDEI